MLILTSVSSVKGGLQEFHMGDLGLEVELHRNHWFLPSISITYSTLQAINALLDIQSATAKW